MTRFCKHESVRNVPNRCRHGVARILVPHSWFLVRDGRRHRSRRVFGEGLASFSESGLHLQAAR